MWSLTVLRNNPHFGRLFDAVHPLCWPILWWQLNRLFRMILADKSLDVLYSVNRWGFITIRHVAKCEDPATYKPPARTFRPLSDPSWESDLPVFASNLAAFETLRLLPILPCLGGGGGIRLSRMTEGALCSQPDTS